MQTANLAFVLEQAQDTSRRDGVRVAVRNSIEVGVVVPSILRSKLEEAGYSILTDTAALADYGINSLNVLKRVIVADKNGTMVAMGAAENYDEALLHAMLGYFRENAKPDEDVPQGLAETPSQPE